jgi:bifunctional non-homologous end joining protein LigD
MSVRCREFRRHPRKGERLQTQQEPACNHQIFAERLLRDAPEAEPTFIEPMKCKPVDALPEFGKWLYEAKLDGFRALALKNGKDLKLISRNRQDLSRRFPVILEAMGELECRKATLDGEIVSLDENGRPSFEALQDTNGGPGSRVFYYAFDLLNYEGRDLTALPLEHRRLLLAEMLKDTLPRIRASRCMSGSPIAIIKAVTTHNLEGIVAKRAGSPYEPGQRSGAWVKFKTLKQQEFVIGGYTPPQGTRQAFGALLIGYYEGGQLRYASKVGSGFTIGLLNKLLRKFKPLVRKQCPFVNVPETSSGRWGQGLTASEMRKCVWLQPKLVCQVGFTEWTEGGHLRHPVFRGMRDDKAVEEVVRE